MFSSFILLPCLSPLLQLDASLLTAVSASIRLCDTNNFNKTLSKMYCYTATEHPYIYVVCKLVDHPP